MEFSQKRLFKKRRITIQEKGINLWYKDGGSEYELFIPYEDLLMSKISKHSEKDMLIAIAGIILSVLGGCFLFFSIISPKQFNTVTPILFLVIASVLFGIYYFMGSKKDLTIPMTNHTKIILFQDKPSAEEFSVFLENLRNAYNNYLLRVYGNVTPKLAIESQLNDLTWLRNNNVITLDEFESLQSQLLGKSKDEEEERIIGFMGKNKLPTIDTDHQP